MSSVNEPRNVPDGPDAAFVMGGFQLFSAVWPIIGNEPPPDVHGAFRAELDRLGEPSSWSERTAERNERLLLSSEGLLAAYYHRDRVAGVERQVIEAIRALPPESLPPAGGSTTMRMPVLAHEFVAYLLAARRTLEYLARGVGACFDRPSVYKITKLASALGDAAPAELAAKAVTELDGISGRFPHLLGHEGELSHRDRVAHYWPIEPAQLMVIHGHDGRIGIDLVDAGPKLLPEFDFDWERMARDKCPLTEVLDLQLVELSSLCTRLLAIAVDAEIALRRAT
jgi:hypothetical protein